MILIKKLHPDSVVPTSKNYIVGVGAIVLNKGNLLVIKDKLSVGYKLPGGYIDKNESIKKALKREVYEETGITAAVNNIGIVFLPNGEYFIISVFVSESKEDFDTNEKIIADIAKATYDFYTTTEK